MKVVNRTRWNTKHLRDILSRVAMVELNPVQRKRLIVTVTYNRQANKSTWCSGWCAYGMMRPKVMVPSGAVDRADLAHVMAHELCHAKGWKHKDFSGVARWNRVGNWREIYAWAEAMPLEPQPIKRKPRPTAEAKIDHCRSMIARWTSKQKRATTGVKAWTRRLKYYERKQAAQGIDKPVES